MRKRRPANGRRNYLLLYFFIHRRSQALTMLGWETETLQTDNEIGEVTWSTIIFRNSLKFRLLESSDRLWWGSQYSCITPWKLLSFPSALRRCRLSVSKLEMRTSCQFSALSFVKTTQWFFLHICISIWWGSVGLWNLFWWKVFTIYTIQEG